MGNAMVYSKDWMRLLLVFPRGNKLPLEYSFSVSLAWLYSFFSTVAQHDIMWPGKIYSCDLFFTLTIRLTLVLSWLVSWLCTHTQCVQVMQWLPTTTSLALCSLVILHFIGILAFYTGKISLTDSQTFRISCQFSWQCVYHTFPLCTITVTINNAEKL